MSRVATALATVPQPCLVLGTALRPFCLGHHLLFRRLQLPFVDDAKAEASPHELLSSIAICAGDYETNLAGFLDGKWASMFCRWQRRVFGPWYARRRVNLGMAEKVFREYLALGYARPPVMEYTSPGGVTLTAPWEELLKCRLVMAGFSEHEVLNGYLPMRWYDLLTIQEITQAENLTDPKHFKPVFYAGNQAALVEAAKEMEQSV